MVALTDYPDKEKGSQAITNHNSALFSLTIQMTKYLKYCTAAHFPIPTSVFVLNWD